ncbi:MAG: efflux RND transporter periplasmic adaptor subunit [Muribaculaceae bacterium]|nr:efflux RND transporter periplasmic adaptor subunit [Muribaculaceae bacterium]
MHSIKFYFQAATIAFCATAIISCGSGEKETRASNTTEELPKVEIKQVHLQDVAQIAEYTATVEAYKTNNITTSTANRIKEILVDVGSQVTKGQRLVILDNVNIEQMKVRLDNTEREYNRAVELLRIGGGTQQAVDQLKTELDASRRQYTNMVENTELVSPITGVVTARNYDPGDMTSAQPILTIEQVRPVKVMVNVSEVDYTKVKKGMKVSVKLDVYGEETFSGTVERIYPTIDPTTRTFTVEINIPNNDERIRPGMFARVEMNFGSANRVVVPDRAIVKQSGSGNKYVYVYKDGKVSFNKVELGQRLDDAYELLSGIENGADVVITGQSRLADGAAVEVINK